MLEEVSRSGAELIPVDSEHNSIYQCLSVCGESRSVRRIALTASGGPFFSKTKEELSFVSVEQALSHPSWSMGAKISIDSATMFNKGLEVIEACYLFSLSPDKVDVIVHPQSLMHGMVEYEDGSVLAAFFEPDMKVPIAHALGVAVGVERRVVSGASLFDFIRHKKLEFFSAG